MVLALVIIVVVLVLLVAVTTYKTVRIVPQARARNVERLGRYRKTLEPGMNFIIPFIDRVKPTIDLREQVVSFQGQRVITEDNLVVSIDTVLFFQITDPRAADYEIVNYIQAVEQLTATMLRSVIGSMDLEQALTSRDKINTMLRGVLDDASGKWGIRVTRVEIKAIDPPQSVKDAMEKQMRAEREKRAAILNAEGVRQSQILTADGDKQGAILRAEGDKQGAILRAQGQAQAISAVNQAIHDSDPDPKLLAYQYLQTLPQLAGKPGNTVWMVPSELTGALKMLSSAFDGSSAGGGGAEGNGSAPSSGTRPSAVGGRGGSAALGGQAGPAELPGQAPLAEAAGEPGLAGNGGQAGPAAAGGQAGPAAAGGQAGPAAAGGQAGPGELPATELPSGDAAAVAADAVTQAAAEAADAARTAGVAVPAQPGRPGSGVVDRQAEGQQDAEG
jgi:regulator of protease activity HflC (stomatin/prohibitin superfamily)